MVDVSRKPYFRSVPRVLCFINNIWTETNELLSLSTNVFGVNGEHGDLEIFILLCGVLRKGIAESSL